MFLKLYKHYLKDNLVLVSLLLLGVLSWLPTMVKSGWVYSYGLGFWGANGHDAIWHLALIENFVRGNWTMPVFAGYPLQNYHLGFDFLVAGLVKLTSISSTVWYFQIIPVIFSFLIGFLTYRFVFLWTKSKTSSLGALFFISFGGSLAWVLGKGESAFWMQQAITTLINPPYALSLVFLLLGLISLLKRKFFFSILFFGLLIQVKAYAGILSLGGLLVAGVWRMFKNKKFDIAFVFMGSLVLSLGLYLLLKRGDSSFPFVWQPFWFLENMMALSDRIGWSRFYSAMMTYKSGRIWLKEIPAYSVAFFIFVLGNFWTRLFFLKDIFKKLDYLKVFLLSVIVAGVMIPMFYLQKGTPWNTIQFGYYSLFFGGILAGISLSQAKRYLLVGLVLITIPTTIMTLKDVYLPSRPPAKLSKGEMEALAFLKKQPGGVVLTYPYDKLKAKEAEGSPPRPLYLYETTAYVSAFSGKTTFLEDEVNLEITGYPWKERRKGIENWYQEPDSQKAREFLKKNNIKYLYWLKGQRAYLGEGQLGLTKIFENPEVDVYMVKSER